MSSSNTETQKLAIAPGINKNTTELDAEGTYTSCDKVRFFYGKPEKLGGWQSDNYSGSVVGVSRDIHTWVDLSEEEYLGFATHQKLQLLNQGLISDITPIVASVCGTDVINTSAGSNRVLVSLSPGAAVAGDFFVFASVTASQEGVNFTSTYAITSTSTTFFTFLASTSAVGTCAGAGGGVNIDFLYPTGNQSNGADFGWGAGTWDTPGVSVCAGWSETRSTGVLADLRQWSLDNWGEDLLANPRGGPIYRWEASSGKLQRSGIMSSAAPSIVNTMVVAQDGRHVIALGTHDVSGDFDPLLIRWSDSEDFTDWTAAATNQAGEFRLENGSFVIGAQETKREILVFTDESLYSMKRIGGPFVFSFTDLGNYNGLAGQHAAVDVNGTVYWMGYSSFHFYDGVIRTLPCTLQEFVFDRDSAGSLNPEQKEKVFAGTNREFNEIIWLYPSKNSDENDRYVIYNYLEGLWYHGTLNRTVWHDTDIFERPLAIATSSGIFIHEQGHDDDTTGMKAQLCTSFFDIGDGDDMVFLDRVIPDSEIGKELNYTLNYKKYPQATEEFTKGPFSVKPTTEKFHPRLRGRQLQICYSTSTQGDDFRIGSDRLSLKPDGKR